MERVGKFNFLFTKVYKNKSFGKDIWYEQGIGYLNESFGRIFMVCESPVLYIIFHEDLTSHFVNCDFSLYPEQIMI